VTARRIVLAVVIAAALVIAAVAFAMTGLRLVSAAADGGDHPAPFPTPSGALARLADPQTAEDREAAEPLGQLPGFPEVTTARLLGRPDGLVVVGWATNAGEICESAYRPGPTVEPESACAMRADFLDGGVSIRWPDSPDLGPFDIRWVPSGELELTSARPPGGIPVPFPDGSPTPSRSPTVGVSG
jgi:hypothetical protein